MLLEAANNKCTRQHAVLPLHSQNGFLIYLGMLRNLQKIAIVYNNKAFENQDFLLDSVWTSHLRKKEVAQCGLC